MSGFTGFITSFCVSALVFGGLYLLRPETVGEKAVKYIFSLIFVSCVANALLGIKLDNIDFSKFDDYTPTVSQSLSQEAVRLTFVEALKIKQINFSDIKVYTTKSSDDSIIINKVTVYSSDDRLLIEEALGGDSAEYEIEVVYE